MIQSWKTSGSECTPTDDFDRAVVEAVALASDVDVATLRPCPAAHLGADEASLAAWPRGAWFFVLGSQGSRA